MVAVFLYYLLPRIGCLPARSGKCFEGMACRKIINGIPRAFNGNGDAIFQYDGLCL